jgi:MULE transposase domain
VEFHYELKDDKIESLFIGPDFMNVSLHIICLEMSLDATHLKLSYRGTMYLATMKMGLKEMYAVALAIEIANECYEVWNSFFPHLKSACYLLEMIQPGKGHNQYGYFNFVSDKDIGLVQALTDVFPRNQSTQCSIHIQSYVLTEGISNILCSPKITFFY